MLGICVVKEPFLMNRNHLTPVGYISGPLFLVDFVSFGNFLGMLDHPNFKSRTEYFHGVTLLFQTRVSNHTLVVLLLVEFGPAS